jgi:hypothetical protein
MNQSTLLVPCSVVERVDREGGPGAGLEGDGSRRRHGGGGGGKLVCRAADEPNEEGGELVVDGFEKSLESLVSLEKFAEH